MDRATAPGFLARQVSLTPDQTEEPRLYFIQSHSAKRGRVKQVYLGVFQKAGTMVTEACRRQPGVSFFSIVKYNLLKSTYARRIYLEPG